MYTVDWSAVINLLMHPFLRTDFNLRFLNALLAPFKSLYNTFFTYRDNVNYKLIHTSQICSITGALNDAFDPDERRLYIEESGMEVITLLNLDDDNLPILLDLDDYQAFLIHLDSSYGGSEYDFIVNAQAIELILSEKYRLRALVDYYKLAGKRYDVIYQSGGYDNDLDNFIP